MIPGPAECAKRLNKQDDSAVQDTACKPSKLVPACVWGPAFSGSAVLVRMLEAGEAYMHVCVWATYLVGLRCWFACWKRERRTCMHACGPRI